MTDAAARDVSQEIDILVVGAGPTGLMLANQLARRGLKPLIIDRHAGPAEQTRAMAVQARTMEIYANMGVIDEALARGAVTGAANMWANGRWTARVPIGDIGRSFSPYPFVLMLGQDENERILGDELANHGVAIHWNTELIALDQSPDHVEATLKQPDGGSRKISATWVAGCDGSRSPVRELSGIGFPGAPYAADVLRRRHRGNRINEGRRTQCLSVAGRLSPVLSDQGQGSLARHRHSSPASARARGSRIRRSSFRQFKAKREAT